jgi:hypothetical protein
MKHLLLAAPLGVLLASGAFAQTSTTEGVTEGATEGATDGMTESMTNGTTGGETSTMNSGSMTYGTTWSDDAANAFYSDPERKTLRTTDEITQQWPSLSQEDRDIILVECARFKADTNATNLTDGSSDATAGTGMDSTADAGTAGTGTADTATTGTATTETATDTDTAGTGTAGATADTTTTGTATTGTDTGTGAAVIVGYDMNAMMVICPAVENL